MTKEEFIAERKLIPLVEEEIKNPNKISIEKLSKRLDMSIEDLTEVLENHWKEEYKLKNWDTFNIQETLINIWKTYYLPDYIDEWIEKRKEDPEMLIQDLRRVGPDVVQKEICDRLGNKLFDRWDILKKYFQGSILSFTNEDLVILIKDWIVYK